MRSSDPEHIAEELASAGIRTIFGIPGSGASGSLIERAISLGSVFYLTHSESAGALMAGTLGLLSEKVAATAISIRGPGVANMIGGLTTCLLETMPMIGLIESATSGIRFAPHKWVRQSEMLSAATKAVFAGNSQTTLLNITNSSEEDPPGPVAAILREFSLESRSRVESLAQSDLPRLTEIAEWAGHKPSRPIAIAGAAAGRWGWANSISRLSIPIFTTSSAKGIIDERLSAAAGVFTGNGGENSVERHLLAEADLVVGFGVRSSELLSRPQFACNSINVDSHRRCSGFVETLPPVAFDLVVDALNGAVWGIDEIELHRSHLEQLLLEGHFLVPHVVRILQQHAPYARVVSDTGNFSTVIEQMWRATKPRGWLGASNSKSMGAAIPIGVGAAIARPHEPTVVIVGDGGIGMHFAELKLALEAKSRLLVILMSDGRLSSADPNPRESRLGVDPFLVPRPHWAAVAQSLGFSSFAVEDYQSCESAIQNWSTSSTNPPTFIQVSFPADRYSRMTLPLI